MRNLAIALVVLAAAACADTRPSGPADASIETLVITLTDRPHPGSWPTARAELGDQRVAFCPVRISTPAGSGELRCEYTVGPLLVPERFAIKVRGDAIGSSVERSATAIRVDARWADSHVSFRVDLAPGEAGTADPDDAADTLRVVCDAERTTVLTPVVRTHRDGLHYSIEAEDGVAEFAFHHIAWEHGMSFGGNVGEERQWSAGLEPGRALVACTPGPRTSYWDVEFATFELIDPSGHWIETGIDCLDTTALEIPLGDPFRALPSARIGARIEDLLLGLRHGDVVRHQGYPERYTSKLYLWDGLVVREGERIAVLHVDHDGALHGTACADAGIDV